MEKPHTAHKKNWNFPRGWGRKIVEFRRMMLISIPVGILAGIGVSGLELLCNAVLWNHLSLEPIYLRLLFPVIGLLISAWVLHRLGVLSVGMLNEVVVHYHAPPEHVSIREDGLKTAACVATVGLGASLGLGGPSQWLGTRIAIYVQHYLTKWHTIRRVPRRQIVLIGAAAGVSAIFRAPLAGTLLALETPFSRDLDGTVLLPASVAAFFGHIVHGWLVDSKPLLPFPASVPHDSQAILGAVAIGVAAGLISRRFQRHLGHIRNYLAHWPWYLRGLAGGILTSATALIAWYYFDDTYTLQAGLPLAHAVFAGKFLGWLAVALLILKILAVWSTAGSTGVAGLLVVTLTVGTLIGAAIHPIVPGVDPATACAIAVCAYLAANYNAPLTGIALSAEWGGAGLLPIAWIAVIIAAWIGEGLANTPSKAIRRYGGHHH